MNSWSYHCVYSCAEYPCSKSTKGLRLPQRIDGKKKFTITYSYSVEFVVSFVLLALLMAVYVCVISCSSIKDCIVGSTLFLVEYEIDCMV